MQAFSLTSPQHSTNEIIETRATSELRNATGPITDPRLDDSSLHSIFPTDKGSSFQNHRPIIAYAVCLRNPRHRSDPNRSQTLARRRFHTHEGATGFRFSLARLAPIAASESTIAVTAGSCLKLFSDRGLERIQFAGSCPNGVCTAWKDTSPRCAGRCGDALQFCVPSTFPHTVEAVNRVNLFIGQHRSRL